MISKCECATTLNYDGEYLKRYTVPLNIGNF